MRLELRCMPPFALVASVVPVSFAVLVIFLLVLVAFFLWTPDENRAVLEAKYLASPADLIEVAGMRLHVQDRGPHGPHGPHDAPAILLIHGFASSLQTWDAWVPQLAETRRTVALDLPGAGLSDPDPTGAYDDVRTVEILTALLDRLGIAKATIVGNSLGGRIAWTFAAAHPERTDRLVLISPDGFAAPGFEFGKVPKTGVGAEAMRFVLPKLLVRKALEPAYADPHALTPDLLTRYDDLLRAPGARGVLIARWQQSVRFDPVPRLRTIAAPTLLLWGEADHVIPFANAQDYLAALPHATLVALPDVGHLPQEEAPARSLDALTTFLDAR